MRAREFIVEDNESRTEEFQGVHMKIRDDGYEVVASALDDWGNEMGSVVFNKGDDNELDPQDLLVIDKFRGQGIAKVMYNYVKSKGYEIHKSPDVTKIADQGKQSGEHFWKKNRGDERVWEAFDQPYKTKSEKSEYGDVDMLAKLPDGTNLSIMFIRADIVDDIWGVEFYRNNSQEVTGEGDAQRIFATVLTAIQKFIKKYQPQTLFFTASKEPEADMSQPSANVNPESRAKLYDRIVQRYAKAWGYRALRDDTGTLVRYELTRLKQGVAEDNDKSKDPIVNTVIDFYQHVGKIHKDPIDDYVGTAKEMLGHVSDPTLKSKLLGIFRQAKQNPYIQGGVVTTIGALLAGGVLNSAQKMGLSPAQTNLVLQAILNTVIPTVVSRINGKSWADTAKYTLASAGIGTGIAGIMDEDELDEDWKSKLATGAMAGAMAMGGAHAKGPEWTERPDGSIVKSIKQAGDAVKKVLPSFKTQPEVPKADPGMSLLSRNNAEAEAVLHASALKAGLIGAELAQFLAQTRHESADFAHMKEIGSKKRFAKYEVPNKAKQLGNKYKGDGERFKGRGFIQLTGRDNYTRASKQIFGDDRLVKTPDLASNLDVASKIALWYWQNQVRPYVNNFNDTRAVTKAINPAMRGLQDRHNNFKEYMAVL